MIAGVVAGVALVIVAVAGCSNQSTPGTIPDGVTPVSENMTGFWNAPGGPGCKWSLRVKSGRKWVTVNHGAGNRSQTMIIGIGSVGGQVRSDKCGGWER